MTEYQDKKQFLLDSFRERYAYPKRAFKFAFVNVDVQEQEGNSYIIGELIKFRQAEEHETFDELQWEATESLTNNTIVARSPFVLEVASGFIAYHPVREGLADRTFREIFASLFEAASRQALIVAEITPVSNRLQILEVIDTFTRVTFVRVSLRPSNPHAARIWERLDDMFQQNGIDRYTETLQATKPNHSINTHANELREKITMAADGYGDAVIQGEVNNETRRVATGQNQVTDTVPAATNLSELLLFLKNTFTRLNRRIAGED